MKSLISIKLKSELNSLPYYYCETINCIPVVIFENHNMSIPVLGLLKSITNQKYNLLTFDYHKDTRPPFCSLQQRKSNGMSNIVSEPNKFKSTHVYKEFKSFMTPDNYSVKKTYAICQQYLKNDEQIQSSFCFGYINSYTIVCKEDIHNYQQIDCANKYDAKYYNVASLNDLSVLEFGNANLILDFDLDFFNSITDFDNPLLKSIKTIIEKVDLITIARETKFFDSLNKANARFNIKIAEQKLLDFIKII